VELTSDTPVSITGDENSILAALDRLFDTGKNQKIAEGRRVQFFEGKRKVKDGTTKKTGHHYWEWEYKDPDTGKRKRPYGGKIETVPPAYQYRIGQYQASIASRGAESLADQLLRPALNELRSIDTG
jgi:hypothetical protein